jgi:hypothetical protein
MFLFLLTEGTISEKKFKCNFELWLCENINVVCVFEHEKDKSHFLTQILDKVNV